MLRQSWLNNLRPRSGIINFTENSCLQDFSISCCVPVGETLGRSSGEQFRRYKTPLISVTPNLCQSTTPATCWKSLKHNCFFIPFPRTIREPPACGAMKAGKNPKRKIHNVSLLLHCTWSGEGKNVNQAKNERTEITSDADDISNHDHDQQLSQECFKLISICGSHVWWWKINALSYCL